MNKVITGMMATDNQPFRVVSSVVFKRVMATAKPKWTLNSEKFYSTEMPSIHSKVLKEIKALLSPSNAGQYLSFTTGCWSGTTKSL